MFKFEYLRILVRLSASSFSWQLFCPDFPPEMLPPVSCPFFLLDFLIFPLMICKSCSYILGTERSRTQAGTLIVNLNFAKQKSQIPEWVKSISPFLLCMTFGS